MEEALFLKLFAISLGTKSKEEVDAFVQDKEIDWSQIYSLSVTHNVHPLIYEAAHSLSAFQKIPEQLKQVWKRQTIMDSIEQFRRTERFLKLYQIWRDRGLTPLVFKGIICRNIYEKSDHRLSSDEDVLIDPKDLGIYQETCEAFRLQTDQSDPEEQVFTYYGAGGLHLELHQKLFDGENPAYAKMEALFTDIRQKTAVVQIGGVEVATFAPTMHFLYLILHGLKHFLGSGFGIRQLGDMMLYAMKYEDQIDWQYVWKSLKDSKYDVLVLNLFDIARNHLGFPWEVLHLPAEMQEVSLLDSEPLLADIMEAGIFGHSSMSRLHSSSITLHAASGQGGTSSVFRTIFPSAKSLQGRYPYLRKYPFLLPVAWMVRIFGYLKEIGKRRKGNSAAESVQIGNQRVDLLKKYKMI